MYDPEGELPTFICAKDGRPYHQDYDHTTDQNGETWCAEHTPPHRVRCAVCDVLWYEDGDYHQEGDGTSYCPEHCPECSEGHS